jgi:hypothetical protein
MEFENFWVNFFFDRYFDQLLSKSDKSFEIYRETNIHAQTKG